MKFHLICLAGPEDKYSPALKVDETALTIPFNIGDHADSVQTNIYQLVAKHDIQPSLIVHDLLNLVTAVYTGDVRISRDRSYDGWTRWITLHLPVSDPSVWDRAVSDVEKALSYLTGDYWEILIRQTHKSYSPQQAKTPGNIKKLDAKIVSLFSGGLDSFIGAIDELEAGNKIVLVGHHSAGGGATSNSQTNSWNALNEIFDEITAEFVQVWLSPPKGENRASEISTRGRSILFIGLGIFVAASIGADRLIVPENGLISLNVPLTNSRLGSLSTRTTHPYFISLVRNIIASLGIDLKIELPYRFYTKGEMIENSGKKDMILDKIGATISCSHPGASRFAGKSPNLHCGYCYPCIIRRAAVNKAGSLDKTKYVHTDFDGLGKGKLSDLRALRLALDRFDKHPVRMADVLVPGPLPGNDEELKKYLGVFSRGLREVRDFLDQMNKSNSSK